MSDIKILREQMLAAQKELAEADEALRTASDLLCSAACKEAGIPLAYIDLMNRVIADPITGPHKIFDRLLAGAIRKDVIREVRGEGGMLIRGDYGVSSNHWYELGEVGERVMRQISNEGWTYERPSELIKAEQSCSAPR